MNKKLLTILFIVLASGCASKPVIKEVYVEKKVPVNSVPQPPKVDRPILETTKLTPEDRKDIGKVSQAVVVENKQLLGYTSILELIINTYKQAADKSELQSTLIVPGLNDTKPKP